MKLGLAFVGVLAWTGCATEMGAPPPGGGGDDGSGTGGSTGGSGGSGGGGGGGGGAANPTDPGEGTGPVTQASGHITANTTWMNTIHVVSDVTVDPSVTLTVAPGTTVDVTSGVGFTISGTLDIQGSKDAKVVFRAATTGGYWADLDVVSGGALTATYLVWTGGRMDVEGSATLTDSVLWHASGDLLTMSNGTLNMSYSQIGLTTGHDSTHCDTHMEGNPTLSITYSNLATASYGMMFYGGHNAILTHNNFFGNGIDMDVVPSDPVSGDVSFGFFDTGTPDFAAANAVVTTNSMATSKIVAGVR